MSLMPATGRSTTTITTTTTPVTTTGSKLRDSCHACAFSKVKCHKEKPACSRCVKRGLTCWYVASKRSSRKHERRASASENGNRQGYNAATSLAGGGQASLSTTAVASPMESCFAVDLTEPGSNSVPPLDEAYPLLRTTGDWTSSLFSNMPSPAELPLSPDLTALTKDLNGFFASPMSFSVPSAPDTDMSSHADFFAAAMETESGNGSATGTGSTLVEQFAMFEDLASELIDPELSESRPLEEENTVMSTESKVENRSIQEACPADDAAYPCLMRAWGLTKLLSTKPSTTCRSSPGPGGEDGAVANGGNNNNNNNNNNDNNNSSSSIHTPSFETIITNNEQAIEAINSMLRCPCLDDDGYLLMTLCMLVFKVLDWYALAARNASAAPNAAAQMGSYCLDGEDAGRMVAQLVLSKLHHVQRLVNQLAASFKAQAAAAAVTGIGVGNGVAAAVPSGSTPDHSWSGSTKGDDDMTPPAATTPFSAVLSDHLAADLRKRLQLVSLEIVQRLRE